MFNTLDHLIIAVEDLDKAEKNYSKIFGISPSWKGEHAELGTSNCLFNFQNTYFELLSATGDGLGADLVSDHLDKSGEGLMGAVFGTDNINVVSTALRGEALLSLAHLREKVLISKIKKYENGEIFFCPLS